MFISRRLPSRLFILLLAIAIAGPARSMAGPAAAWVQMIAAGAQARLVTMSPTCPVARVDGAVRSMVERAGPSQAFPGRVCELTLRRGDRRVAVEDLVLDAPRPRIDRIVMLGDTGCRMKDGAFQRCNDPEGWPFARVAALAAAEKPDLVIHVGDYYYRESPCPPGDSGCAGSPHGDTWASWKAELFDPARGLLAAAPWVFARGNHEDCKRGGPGWFRLLDAAPVARACPAESDSFAVEFGGIRLLVADSSDTEDLVPSDDRVAAFKARLAPLRSAPAGDPIWIVTHRPIWNPQRLGDLVADGLVNATERRAVKSVDLSSVGLIVSGHVHNFATLAFGATRPPQLVVGTGGDTLDFEDTPPPAAGVVRVDGMRASIFTMGRFGFFVFDRHGRDWIGRFHDLHDRVAAICLLHERSLKCQAA